MGPTASNMYAPSVVKPPAPASMSFTSSTDTSIAGLGTDAKSAYDKLATMDPLGLVDKPPAHRANPFENTFTAAAPAPTLAGIKAMTQTLEKKHVMQVSPENTSTSNALIMTGNQNNNWGLNNNVTQTGTTNHPLPYPGTLQNQALGTSAFQTSTTNQPYHIQEPFKIKRWVQPLLQHSLVTINSNLSSSMHLNRDNIMDSSRVIPKQDMDKPNTSSSSSDVPQFKNMILLL